MKTPTHSCVKMVGGQLGTSMDLRLFESVLLLTAYATISGQNYVETTNYFLITAHRNLPVHFVHCRPPASSQTKESYKVSFLQLWQFLLSMSLGSDRCIEPAIIHDVCTVNLVGSWSISFIRVVHYLHLLPMFTTCPIKCLVIFYFTHVLRRLTRFINLHIQLCTTKELKCWQHPSLPQ